MGTAFREADARAHSPDGEEPWKWTPKIVMGDGATAADAAALKVFDYNAELEGPGAAHNACSAMRDGAYSKRL